MSIPAPQNQLVRPLSFISKIQPFPILSLQQSFLLLPLRWEIQVPAILVSSFTAYILPNSPMGERKHPKKDSLREKKWDNIFNALVELSQKLQNDRQILEGRVIHLQKVIYKVKKDLPFWCVRSTILCRSFAWYFCMIC